MEDLISAMAQSAVPWLVVLLGFFLFYVHYCKVKVSRQLSICEISNIEIYGMPAASACGAQARDLLREMLANSKRWRRRHWLWLARHVVCMHIMVTGAYLALALCIHAVFAGDILSALSGVAVSLVFVVGMMMAWSTIERINKNRVRIQRLVRELSRIMAPATAGKPPLSGRITASLGSSLHKPHLATYVPAMVRGWRNLVRYADSSTVHATRSVTDVPLPSTHGH